jgi:Pectate lyase superfamily protein
MSSHENNDALAADDAPSLARRRLVGNAIAAGVGISAAVAIDATQTASAQTVGTVSLPDGSASAPSLNFVADTDTGLFRVGNDVAGFSRSLAVCGPTPWVDARAFGAVGNNVADDTAALQAALNAVPPGGLLYIPPGAYVCSSALVVPNYHVSIRGAGRESTVLTWRNAIPGGKAIVANFSVITYCFAVTDMTLVTGAANNGTAISAEWPVQPWDEITCRFERLTFTAATRDTSAYWTRGIAIKSGANGIVRDVVFRGIETANGDAPPTLYPTAAFELGGNCTGILFDACIVGSVKHGIKVTDPAADNHSEGIQVRNCQFVDVNYGIEINQADTGVPGLFVRDCHISFYQGGVVLHNRVQNIISGNLMYSNKNLPNQVHVYCAGGGNDVISGNAFIRGGAVSYGVVLATGTHFSVVQGNSGSTNAPLVWAQAGSYDNLITGNNNGGLPNPAVLDNGTNNTVSTNTPP